MDLPSIGSAIQTLQGIKCDKQLQSVNVLAFAPKLLEHCPLTELDSFLLFYQSHHSLDVIPSQTIIPMDDKYPNAESHTAVFQAHAASLQKEENKGIEMYNQCLTSILTIPTLSHNKQVEEDICFLDLKKLSMEIIQGKATEDTAMELNSKGATNYEQLKKLICKECDKCD